MAVLRRPEVRCPDDVPTTHGAQTMPVRTTAVRCPFCTVVVDAYDASDPLAEAEARVAAEAHLQDHVAEMIATTEAET